MRVVRPYPFRITFTGYNGRATVVSDITKGRVLTFLYRFRICTGIGNHKVYYNVVASIMRLNQTGKVVGGRYLKVSVLYVRFGAGGMLQLVSVRRR